MKKVKSMLRNRVGEMLVIALVVSIISFLINIENPSGVVIVTSLASTALALIVAPDANTNTIRSVFVSYIIALFVSVTFDILFQEFLDNSFDNKQLLFFMEFFIMLSVTLLLFHYLDAYHPPSVGAMLTYFIDHGFSDYGLMIFVPISVVFLLATIKVYLYWAQPTVFKWSDFPKEFRRFPS